MTIPTKILNITSANFKCIKNDETRNTLTEAIKRATNNVYAPKLIPATETVKEVSAIKASHTKIYVELPM